jgi:hypothetical protein
MMNLLAINAMPTTHDDSGKIHESIFRSYHILNYVLEMVNRGDSKETINDVVAFLQASEEEKTRKR